MTAGLQKHIAEANQILASLGLPRGQQNERSALCLLALLNLTPRKKWDRAEDPLMGITPIMNWVREHYKKLHRRDRLGNRGVGCRGPIPSDSLQWRPLSWAV